MRGIWIERQRAVNGTRGRGMFASKKSNSPAGHPERVWVVFARFDRMPCQLHDLSNLRVRKRLPALTSLEYAAPANQCGCWRKRWIYRKRAPEQGIDLAHAAVGIFV